ncbi:MAG: Ig-like domain-containing protein, partial [Blastocatellia bacterium]
ISGRALLNGSGLGGVLVTLGGGQAASVMTDADGHYAFTGLPAGLSYVVTPSRANLTFNPLSLAFDNLAGDQTGDFTAILPTVILAAAAASASEPGADTGAFTIARSGNIDAPLTIVYTISGAATNGVDYDEITGSVTISAGAAAATIPINPKDDALVEGSETVTLTLLGSGDYVIGAQGEATVIIADNDPGSLTVSITAPANGENFAEPANITITAEASTSGGAVSKVEFFAGETKLGEATIAPYSAAWLTVPAGAYVLTAKATDNQGNVVTSGPATITVGAKVTSVSAASYRGPALASGSIVAAFGANLATETKVASPSNVGQDGILSHKSSSQLRESLPTTEAGSTVKVKDSLGTERLAPLFSISPAQINYQIPLDTALGTATVTVTINDQVSAVGVVEITRTEPGLFSADGSGQGLPAAVIQRVKLDGTITTEPVARYDEGQQRFVAAPIDLGAETDQVFLVLFGTGFRSHERGAECTIGGVNAEVLFAGAQGVFVGLDQANVRLPRALIGGGEVEVLMTIADRPANPMKIEIK